MTFDVSDCIIMLYTNGSFNKLNKLCDFEKLIVTKPIHSHVFISVGPKKKWILHCSNLQPKEVFLKVIYLLKPRCTIRNNYHTIINPIYVQNYSTLLLIKNIVSEKIKLRS